MERLLEIRDRLLAVVAPLPGERVALAEAEGRWLSREVAAAVAAPPDTCSAMDGFAVRAAEIEAGAVLRVGQTIFAGARPGPLAPGVADRIFTGAPLPSRADAVVREEAVELDGGRVRFRAPASPGENVRWAGEDVAAGGRALEPGQRLGPRQLALLQAVGVGAVDVVRRPAIALLSTGDEVVTGRVPDSNGAALAGLLRDLGARVERAAIADRVEDLRREIGGALARCDAVVTVGGVSVGARDHVPEALRALGAEVLVHGVPMKPGKPFLFAMAAGRPAICLPGSPAACLAAFEVFGRPALLALAGAARRSRPTFRLRLADPVSGRPGRARLLWARLEPDGRARPVGRDAAQIRGPALADLLLLVPSDAGDLPAGAEVTAWSLADGP